MNYKEFDRFNYLCQHAFDSNWLNLNKKIDTKRTIFNHSTIPRFYDVFKEVHTNEIPLISDIITPSMVDLIDNIFNYHPIEHNSFVNRLRSLLNFPFFMCSNKYLEKYSKIYNTSNIKVTPVGIAYRDIDIDKEMYTFVREEHRDLFAETIFKKDGSADQFFDTVVFNENSPLAKLYRMGDVNDYITPIDILSPSILFRASEFDCNYTSINEVPLNDPNLNAIITFIISRTHMQIVSVLEDYLDLEGYKKDNEIISDPIEFATVINTVKDQDVGVNIRLNVSKTLVKDSIIEYINTVANKIPDHSVYEYFDFQGFIEAYPNASENDIIRCHLSNLNDFLEKFLYTNPSLFNDYSYKIKLFEDMGAIALINLIYKKIIDIDKNVKIGDLETYISFYNNPNLPPEIDQVQMTLLLDFIKYGSLNFKSLIKKGWLSGIPYITSEIYNSFKMMYPDMPEIPNKQINYKLNDFEEYYENEIGFDLNQISSI